jgi:hypothetical protein
MHCPPVVTDSPFGKSFQGIGLNEIQFECRWSATPAQLVVMALRDGTIIHQQRSLLSGG